MTRLSASHPSDPVWDDYCAQALRDELTSAELSDDRGERGSFWEGRAELAQPDEGER